MDLFSSFWTFLILTFVAAVIALLLLSVILYMVTEPYPVNTRTKEEESYYDPKTKARVKFPDISEAQSINLSVVVPAYNEMERLPPMLDEALNFLESRTKERPSYAYEIIVVSDGSTDRTVQVATQYVEKYGVEKVRCLELVRNRGKGGAVRLGVQCSRGAAILFADADGASKFEDLAKLEAALKDVTSCDVMTDPAALSDSLAVVIGSRAHLEKESLATRSLFRNILMYGFHFLVWVFTVQGIKDTQCGFKLFSRRAAAACFPPLHVNRWAFDVELLYIAQKLNIPISEIPVRWTEIEGSKVTPIISWVQMGCDLALIWLRYTIGAWKIKTDKID